MLTDVTAEGSLNRGKWKKVALMGKVLLLLAFVAMLLMSALGWSPGGGQAGPQMWPDGCGSTGRLFFSVAGGRFKWTRPRITTIEFYVDGETVDLATETGISNTKFGWGETVTFDAPEGAETIRIEAAVTYRRSVWQITQEWQHTPDRHNPDSWTIQNSTINKTP
jgi:hypothetical protein